MRVNPGGMLSSEEVVGRDRLIQKRWRILDRQSLARTAERRMGMISIVKKQSQTDAFDAESVRDVLTLLQRDHYVEQADVNAFRFRFALIQQSWVIHRGLAA